MRPEHPSGTKLAKLVPNHVLGDENTVKNLAVVDQKRVPHKLRDNRAAAGPRLDRFPPVHLRELLNLPEELLVYIRAFFCRSGHD